MFLSLLRRFAYSVRSLVVVFCCWAMMANSAWAADGENTAKGWVTSYFLVGLGITLGLIAVLRPVGRTTEVKLKKDDD